MPQKARVITVVATLAVLWAVHNVSALKPVKEFMNFDQ
jgi:hypothetical protein